MDKKSWPDSRFQKSYYDVPETIYVADKVHGSTDESQKVQPARRALIDHHCFFVILSHLIVLHPN